MRTVYYLAVLGMTLVLSACGGSGSDAAPGAVNNEQAGGATDQSGESTGESSGDSSGDSTGDGEQASDEDTTGGDAEPPAPSLSGKVIDGYVSGATVWLDFNNNGVFEDGEPTAVSGEAGNYSLELTESQQQCAQYATLYVDVPVGAMDEDLGEVTEAYQMVRPPQMSPLNDDSLLHISPLTTVLWQGIQTALGDAVVQDCDSLLADQALREELQALVDDTIANTVSLYNISAQTIFDDFIAEGDDEAKALAQQFVTGLQRSFAYTATVKADYPQADEIRVVHYYGKNAYFTVDEELHWFRDVVVFNGDAFVSREDLMNDTLDEIVTPIYYRDSIDTAWGDGQLNQTVDAIYNGAGQGFRCSVSEQVTVTAEEVVYKLQNYLPSGQQVASVEECDVQSFVGTTPRRIFYVSYSEEGSDYLADLRQEDGSVTVLPNWVGFEGASASFDTAELVGELSQSGYRFDGAVTITTSSWAKRRTWDDGVNTYQVDYNSAGDWVKTTTAADGTSSTECSDDEGATWQACAS